MNKNTPIEQQRPDNIPLAVGVIVVTVLALSLGDALFKMTSSSFVIWQIFVICSVIAIPCLALFMALTARASLQIPDAVGWTILRSLLLMSMWVSYYVSLPKLTLSVAAAAYYTLPIFITLFSAILVGDKINGKGWFAVMLGFAGVFLILKPEKGDFNGYVLLPLLSAILYAFAMILTRTKCRSVHPLMLSLALNVSFVLVGGIVAAIIETFPGDSRQGFLLAPWIALGPAEWLSMGLLAIAILIGSIGAAIAYQNAPLPLLVRLILPMSVSPSCGALSSLARHLMRHQSWG